jgi:hypothetical protein
MRERSNGLVALGIIFAVLTALTGIWVLTLSGIIITCLYIKNTVPPGRLPPPPARRDIDSGP